MISFIIPAKNVSRYIEDCLNPFKKLHDVYDFEVIVIDDNSSDDTLLKTKIISEKYPKIKIYPNTGKGKVQALNYGYSLSSGKIIKCIDSDDVLLEEIFPLLKNQPDNEAIMHDLMLTDSELNPTYYLSSNSRIVSASYKETITENLSLPRCAWSFSRSIGDRIFPMPNNIPFEDVWFSFSIKKYAIKINYVPESFYLYRQHSNQTFGGVFNFSEDIVRFRANRMLEILPIIQKSELGFDLLDNIFLDNISFFRYIAENNWTYLTFLKLKVSSNTKIRFFLILFFPKIAQLSQSLLWEVRNFLRK